MLEWTSCSKNNFATLFLLSDVVAHIIKTDGEWLDLSDEKDERANKAKDEM